MSRSKKILQHINLGSSRGLEIGPLTTPVVPRSLGEVFYVDRVDTDGLKAWYEVDEAIDLSKIVTIDFVWCEQPLREVVGASRLFDYCIASHVIEHVPDMVGWLHEIREVLVEGGVLSLVIPDKRFTFDLLRPLTTVADIVDAHLQRLRKPSSRQIYDHFSNFVSVDAGAAWADRIDEKTLVPVHSRSFALEACHEAIENDRYIDAHCSVFTPESFIDSLRVLSELDLLGYEVAGFYRTEPKTIEFFVALRKLSDGLDRGQRHRALVDSLPKLEGQAS